MDDVSTGPAHRPPPEVLRRLALNQRLAARAVSHTRVADAVLRRRTPKLLRASTRLAPLRETAGRSEPAQLTPWAAGVVPAPAVSPEPTPRAAAPLSEEAATFRSMMRQRYDMPDEMFDAMFGGGTPVYQGVVPTIPPPVADGPATDLPDADVPVPTGPAPEGHEAGSRAPAPARTAAQPPGRGARIVEGAPGGDAPAATPRRRAAPPGKRLSSRPATDTGAAQ